ncbi:hypothetical protein B0H14DRAFT_3781497 [Mycena olivaceomarginata]|nr:hypothetical protein B0H14DRAFT_3781497 [Mycena olivaceomarginata]
MAPSNFNPTRPSNIVMGKRLAIVLSTVLLGLCLEHIPGWSFIHAQAVFLLICRPRLPVLPVKWVLILGIGLIQTGSLICELAQNVCILIAGRVVSGVGGVGIILAIFEVFTRVTLFFKETRHRGLPLSLEICRRPVAAHSALPVEMLQRIFLFCGGVSDLNEIAEPGTQPILLALCVALDTAELWSDIKVTLRHKTLERLLAPSKVWLCRARHHPLTLELDVVLPVPRELIPTASFGRRGECLQSYSSTGAYPDLPSDWVFSRCLS